MAADLAKKFAAFRVLVVDDIQSARWTSKHLLHAIGFQQIDEARSGREALEKLRSQAYNLVVSDWNMADMHGLELFKAMKADETLKKVPFVMVTGSVAVEKVKEAISAGIHAYVAKPVTEQALRSAIATALTNAVKQSVAG